MRKERNMKKKSGRPQPFGTVVKGRKVNFAVQVPAGKKCELLLYREGRKHPECTFDMPENEGIGEVRFIAVEDIDADKYEYNFRIDGQVSLDPYVREVAGKKLFGRKRELQEHEIRGKLVSPEYDWSILRMMKGCICHGMKLWPTVCTSEGSQSIPHPRSPTKGLISGS